MKASFIKIESGRSPHIKKINVGKNNYPIICWKKRFLESSLLEELLLLLIAWSVVWVWLTAWWATDRLWNTSWWTLLHLWYDCLLELWWRVLLLTLKLLLVVSDLWDANLRVWWHVKVFGYGLVRAAWVGIAWLADALWLIDLIKWCIVLAS